jgi:hypothetical protein
MSDMWKPTTGEDKTHLRLVTETRRPTLTRAVGLTVMFGPVGTLLSLAWRKKEKKVFTVER